MGEIEAMTTARVKVDIESPLSDDCRRLIDALNRTLLALTPPAFCFHMMPEEMAEPETTVFVARVDGQAVACGALKRHGGGIGEVKRMYTEPAFQGQGLGRCILDAIEAQAHADGLTRLVLETGDRHPAAWRVYERAGFSRCGPVLDYPDSGWSVFYEKHVTERTEAA